MGNDYIICKIQPFMYKQKIDIYQDNKCIKTTSCTLSDFSDTILTLADQHDVYRVNLGGNRLVTGKIKEDLEKKNLEKYCYKNFEVFLY